MKTCFKCGITKPLAEFHKHKRMADGHLGKCATCVVRDVAVWRNKNPAARKAEYAKAVLKVGYAEKKSVRGRKYRDSNADKIKQYNVQYTREHLVEYRMKCVCRRATKLQATPAWANDFIIAEAYALSALRTQMTGFKWHVDHIVPLQSKFVCGLHVHNNLQVIPATQNLKKSNRYWPDMP